jgi:hypothetical protein
MHGHILGGFFGTLYIQAQANDVPSNNARIDKAGTKIRTCRIWDSHVGTVYSFTHCQKLQRNGPKKWLERDSNSCHLTELPKSAGGTEPV